MTKTQISSEYKALRYDMAKSKRKYHVRNTVRKWGVVVVVALLLLVIVITAFSSNTFGSTQPMATETVIVESGDSLWQIASQYAGGRDVREVVQEIKLYNSLENADLYPGMVLQIPIPG